MDATELCCLIGFPARALGRLPLCTRYIFQPLHLRNRSNEYMRQRYHGSFTWRPWLSADIVELEKLEYLINQGSEDEILQFRNAQLASGAMTTVVVGRSWTHNHQTC